MNIGLIGYGKMGQTIEKIALSKKYNISFIIDTYIKKNSFADISPEKIADTQVVIEFTQPDAVCKNILKCAELGLPVVTGTTGWYEKIEQIESKICEKVGVLYGSNFSIGVNLVFNLLANFSEQIAKPKIYDAVCIETHHKWKKDSPSGTAKEICNIVNKKFLSSDSEIPCCSARFGNVIGKHEVIFDSEFDDIAIIHNAKNRDGFALGAVLGAGWLVGKKGIFNFKDEFTNIMNFAG